MIRHIVLIRFRADVSDRAIAAIFAELAALRGVIPGFRHLVAGKSESPEEIERGYMHGFVADFDDWEALKRYADDERHKAAGAKLVANAVGGIDGILVFDLAC
ncbi:Dabb family protein [Methylovirgula sp. 4M-Z18]|uniref:Dabb family protein n=1 Tax=Methylovirgula sp. 4M-Z18 TaxID=2293567 RepID=UPI000E2EBA53|nr:Dabb family protein [Methylovirgula sp. 4M-Z18]RFB78337.1 Dabb family protein [Methylovirgula sp. 4M-Z18]